MTGTSWKIVTVLFMEVITEENKEAFHTSRKSQMLKLLVRK